MEHNHSIPKTKHIHKSIQFILFTLVFSLCITFITPLTAHADEIITQVEAECSDGTVTSSGGKWYATYCPTAGYKGQGVLLYLLERDGGGAVAGTTPKAFACGETMESYELHAQDKYNRYPEVTTWEGTDPYWSGAVPNNGGFIKDSITFNTTAIKSWLKTPYDGNSTQGIWMIKSIWGPDIATRFTNEEIILVAEPIVAVKFAQYCSETLKFEKGCDSEVEIRKKISRLFNSVNKLENTEFSPDLFDLLDECIGLLDDVIMGVYYGPIATDVVYDVIDKLNNLNGHINLYYPLGDTYAGTPKMVASYYASLSPEQHITGWTQDGNWKKSDSGQVYYRKLANAAAVIMQGSIICSNANFTLWNRTLKEARQIHPDSNIQTYSIGMLAMLAFTSEDGQTTADESLIPTEHPAPDESDGTTTIIKSYRTRNTTTNTLQDRGTYPRSNLTNKITIEDEDTYKVIAWKTSTQLNSSISSLTWESSVPGIIGDQGTSSTSLTLPASQKYLYVLLEKPDTPTLATTNYTLTQSSITRHIYLSQPDAQLTMPQIQSHTFTWYIPAHPEGTCGGHPYNFHCGHSHNSDCYTDELDCTNTSPTHTHTDSCYDTQLDCNHSCNDDCAWDTAYCTWGQWTNTDLTFNLTNTDSNSYPDILATKSGWQTPSFLNTIQVWNDSRNRGTQSAFTVSNTSSVDYTCIIHRGKDKLTLASWKNSATVNSSLSGVSSSGYSVANTNQGTRQTADYNDSFTINIANGSSDLTTSRGITSGSGHGDCNDYNVTGSFVTSTSFNAQPIVQVQVYSGNPSAATNNTECTSTDIITTSGSTIHSGRMVPSGTITLIIIVIVYSFISIFTYSFSYISINRALH